MNHQNQLNFNKSSLVGLQAELARKKEEADRNQKCESKNLSKLEIKPHIEAQFSHRKEKNPPESSLAQDETPEDTYLLKYSRESLITKSKLYDKLRDQELKPDDTDQYLVDFDAVHDSSTVDIDDNSDPESEWVTFTDSLGRSRTCLRADLSYYKELDSNLNVVRHLEEDLVTGKTNANESAEVVSEELKLWNRKREELRKMWEEEEKRLTEKRDIHYQDVLFDEARVHGVGYFRFSQDEMERQKQQEELKRLREDTEKNQMATMTLKERREQQMKQRIEAAKRRKRERLGLPSQNEAEETDSPILDELIEPKVDESRETENLGKKVEEFLRNVERTRHVRPWDVGKEGLKPRVLNQEEWNEKQRAKRLQEFAPPVLYTRCTPQKHTGTLYFTPKKVKSEEPKHHKSVPIQFEYDIERINDSSLPADRHKKGVQVPPPVCYETSIPMKKPNKVNITNSIDAGLNYLKHETEKNKKRNRPMFDTDFIL